MLKTIRNRKAMGTTGAIVLVSIFLLAIVGTVIGLGFGLGWFTPGEIVDDDIPGWTTDLKGTIQNAYDDYAGYAGATVRIYDENWILKQTVTSNTDGVFETTIGTMESFKTYTFVVGSKTNGTSLPQVFYRVMPGMDVVSVPSIIALTEPLLYKPTADETSVSIYWLEPGSTLTTWNKTAKDTNILEGDIQVSITTDGQGLRNTFDYANKIYDDLVLTILINEGNATNQASRIGTSGIPYDDKGSGSGWITLTLSLTEFHRELDADGKITFSGKTTIPFEFDFENVDWTNCDNGTTEGMAFYFRAYVTIGTTQADWNEFGAADGTSVFNTYQELVILY